MFTIQFLFILPFSSAFIHLFSFSLNSLSLVLCLFYVSVCFSSFVVKLHKGCISWMVGATQTKVSWHYYWTKDDERFNTKINDTKQKHTSRDMSHMGCWLIPEITFIWCTNCYSWTGLITIWNLFLTVFYSKYSLNYATRNFCYSSVMRLLNMNITWTMSESWFKGPLWEQKAFVIN